MCRPKQIVCHCRSMRKNTCHRPILPGPKVMPKDIQCGFSVHVDAVAAWLGTFGGADSPHDISRGMFAGEVGTPRLLQLFDRLGIKTSWFIPGHSIETFPKQMEDGRQARSRSRTARLLARKSTGDDASDRKKTFSTLHRSRRKLSGTQAASVLLRHGGSIARSRLSSCWRANIKYDSSMMHHDHECYRLRTGDSWTPIDYSQRC